MKKYKIGLYDELLNNHSKISGVVHMVVHAGDSIDLKQAQNALWLAEEALDHQRDLILELAEHLAT
jgi:hypothetical protein